MQHERKTGKKETKGRSRRRENGGKRPFFFRLLPASGVFLSVSILVLALAWAGVSAEAAARKERVGRLAASGLVETAGAEAASGLGETAGAEAAQDLNSTQDLGAPLNSGNPQGAEEIAGEEVPLGSAASAGSEGSGSSSEKIVYLTFDDGPSEENTGMVLDTLKARNIKATFFLVGENVRKHPDMARRIAAEGHTIGIHCNRHDYKEIYQSVESFMKDFDEAYQAVYEATGVEPKLYRFPGGSINAYNRNVYQNIIEAMNERGFIYFDWNASLEDSLKKTDPAELIANAKATMDGKKRVVLLAHDIFRSTALCLEALLDEMAGYDLRPLTPEVEQVKFHL